MCGIFGAWLPQPLEKDHVKKFMAATHKLAHRGPDEHGAYTERENGLFLGHQRLSIIDLSKSASQPMSSDGVVIAFNGEIYNFVELREELEATGHKFQTKSDTEVLLKAFCCWGNDAFRRFDGMFSVAIRHPGGLTLATDSFGEKPLFVVSNASGIYFSSEPTPLIELLKLEFSPTNIEVAEFLNFGFMLSGRTGFLGLQAVTPATVMTFTDPISEPKQQRYWSPPPLSEGRTKLSPARIDEFHGLLVKSVARRLRADVPIGLFLSAGIDSSLIAAICAKDLRQDLQTFTVTFPDGLDEAKQAKRIASHLGIIHKTIEVSDDPFKGDLPKALKSFYGIPNDNLTAVSVYQLSLAARPSIKVALSGTGGDELAVGYNKYDFLRKRRLAYQMPPKMASLAASTLEMLFLHRKAEMVRTFLVGGNMHRVSALKNGRASNRLTSLSNLVDLPAVTSRDRSWVNKMRSFDLEATLPASYISSVDRGSMRAGLEVRCPYLNTELFEYVAGFDSSNLIGKGRKYLLKTILARYLPKAFFERPKTGFVRPVSKWASSIENPFKNSALETPFLPNPEDHNEVMIALRLALLQLMVRG